jgi:septum formation protein
MKTLWLASGSPRRMSMLQNAGFDPQRVVIDLDDDTLAEAVEGVESTCLARAWFKACAAQHALSLRLGDLSEGEPGILLAADTLCESEGRLLGKPLNAQEATDMIRHLSGREHRTITGVALLDLAGSHRSIWSDSTLVRVGPLTDDQVQSYVASGEWRGKSGGYNLADRIDAGWDIEIDGDPDTVMGLPMRGLLPRLNKLLMGAS